MGEELYVMLGKDLCLNLRSTTIGGIEGTFLDVLLPKTKLIFLGIIYRPPNNINFLECFNKNLDDINLNNEVFLHGDFIIISFIMANIFSKKTKLSKIEFLVHI